MIPIPTPLLQSTLNYLSKQPWGEVNDLIAGLAQASREAQTPRVVEQPPKEEAAGE